MFSGSTLWLIIGFGGQFLFSMRFIIQWLSSERAGRSVVPPIFWWFSIAGGLTLFLYALHRRDPVFAFGQGLGLLIYVRNLYWVLRDHKGSEIDELDGD